MIGLVIIDTFAKLVAAGGGDEDKAKDQGKVFDNIERFKEGTGRSHVALIGHTGKDEARGARGSNAFYGDVDVLVTISGDEIKTATVPKPMIWRKARCFPSCLNCSSSAPTRMATRSRSTSAA